MTIQELLESATKRLEKAGVPSARLDCLVLMEDILERGRAEILAHPEITVSTPNLAKMNKFVTQRSTHVPLAYIRGKAPFFGREFILSDRVLVPRPETETMIELLMRVASYESRVTILDIGTGSGAIAVTAKLELPKARVIATDIDMDCLKTARQNAARLKADINFLHGDLLEPVRDSNLVTRDSILMANLPYVPEHYTINRAAGHEPRHAIFGGEDGLNFYRLLWEQVGRLSIKPPFALTESLPTQHNDMAALAQKVGYQPVISRDFIQVFRQRSASAAQTI